MTRDEAMAEAKRRWGWLGHVDEGKFGRARGRFYVYGFLSQGAGDSWEAAFEDAERKSAGLTGGRVPPLIPPDSKPRAPDEVP